MKPVETIAIFTSVLIGGTWRYVNEMVTEWRKQGINILLIRAERIILHIDFWNKEEHISYTFPYSQNMDFLIKILKSYHVGLIHFQHTLNTKLMLLNLPKLLKVPYIVTLHDYYLICPFVKLCYETGNYCGEKGNYDCNQCLKRRNFYSQTFFKTITDIDKWRDFWGSFLYNAFRVIVPNEDVKRRFLKYYPEANISVIENPEMVSPAIRSKYLKTAKSRNYFNIGILGLLDSAKGRDILLRCSQLSSENQLPLHFILFGELLNYSGKVPKACTVLGRYKEEEIYDLIAENDIDFFWFPAICPETYSYTLSIPIRAGVPVIGTNLGAIGERIQRHQWGETYDYTEPPKKIVGKLQKFSINKNQYKFLEITNTSYPKAEEYYQLEIDKSLVNVTHDKESELRKEELWECNHSNLHHLNGWELKKLVSLATSPFSILRYFTRVNPKWAYSYLMSHSLKNIMSKVIRQKSGKV